jgi:hypothetical protein
MALDLKKLKRASSEMEQFDDADRAERNTAFRSKVAIQQFMNHNGPLFSAFAKAGVDVSEVIEGEVLKTPASEAMKLAALVAAKVAGKSISEVSANDLRSYRAVASSYVASRWLSGRSVDVERASSEIAAAASLANNSWDHDVYRDDNISDNASLMITAANAAASLAGSVEKYDFRKGRIEVLGRLVSVTATAAAKAARSMLGPQASEADLRNVTQTAARNFATILESCYERKAREVVKALSGMKEDEKVAWYDNNDPVSDILNSFEEWALCFSGFAVAASRDMAAPRNDAVDTRPARSAVPAE